MLLRIASAAALLIVLSVSNIAQAVGTLIPVSAPRKDFAHDIEHGIIYISGDDRLMRYSIATSSFLDPIILGGTTGGMDISPDGETLAVADWNDGEDVRVHLVDLDTLQVNLLSAPQEDEYEGGAYSVAFGSDGRLLMTSQFNGSGWVPMRRFDVSMGTSTVIADVRQDTMLSASGDRQTIAFAESNISSGDWGLYDVPTQQLVRRRYGDDGTSWFNYTIATDRFGAQFAIPVYGGTYIYDDVYENIAILGQYAGPQGIGAAYHPSQNLLYLPWRETREVRVYDTVTLSHVSSLDFEDDFGYAESGPFGQGRTRISSDGTLLMVGVSNGVRFHWLYSVEADPVTATVTAPLFSAKPNIHLLGHISDGRIPIYSIVQAPSHGSIFYMNGSRVLYMPASGFIGTDTFRYRVQYGSLYDEAMVTVNVVPRPSTSKRATVQRRPVPADAESKHRMDPRR